MGNVYIADTGNNVVRKVTVSTGMIATLPGYYNFPYGIALDGLGNVYISDGSNDRVTKLIVSTGTITKIVNSFINKPSDVAINTIGLFNNFICLISYEKLSLFVLQRKCSFVTQIKRIIHIISNK